MKKLFLILACLVGSMQASADDCYFETCSDCFGVDAVLTYDIGGGYRQDRLEWDVYPSYAPDTKITEKWKKLEMGIVETNAQLLVCEHYLLTLDFDYGWFSRGAKQHVKTIDLTTNTLLQNATARTRGHAYNIDAAVGYQFNAFCYRLSFAPLVGYAYSFQKFKDTQYSNKLVPGAEFLAHNSYKYRWRGPTLGFTTAYQMSCDWQLYCNYAYHWVRYRAKAHEKFDIEMPVAHQKANSAYGNEVTLGTTYEFAYNWMFGIKVNYKIFRGNRGKSVIKIPQTQDAVIRVESPLRRLQWDSLNATIDIGYIF